MKDKAPRVHCTQFNYLTSIKHCLLVEQYHICSISKHSFTFFRGLHIIQCFQSLLSSSRKQQQPHIDLKFIQSIPSIGAFLYFCNKIKNNFKQLTSGVTISCTAGSTDQFTLPIGLTSTSTGIKTISGTISSYQNPFSIVNTIINVGYLNGCTGSPQNQISQTLQFTAGQFQIDPNPDVQLSSSSTVIGSTGNTLTVKFVPHTILQILGIINLAVPPYYSLSTGNSLQSIINYDPNNLPSMTSNLMTISNVQFRPTDRILAFQFSLTAPIYPTTSTPITFTVNQFNNPINKEPLGGFQLTTLDINGNTIDLTLTSFSLSGVTVAAMINTASIQLLRTSDSVQDYTIAQRGRKIQVSFAIDFPVQDNCFVKITFPQEIKIDADDTLDSYTGQGFISSSILSSQVIKRPYINGANLATCDCNYVLIPGCTDPGFLGASGQGIIQLASVVSPAQKKDTGYFQIDFYKDQGMISQIATTKNNGMSLNFLASNMNTGQATPKIFAPGTDNIVQEVTDFNVQFTLTNNLYADSIIEITAPQEVTSQSPTSCGIISLSSQFDTGAQCRVTQTNPPVFQIYKPFYQSRPELWAMVIDSISSATFSLQINGIYNPLSVQSVKGWSVKTSNLVNGQYYPVDQTQINTLPSTYVAYTPVSGTLSASSNGGLQVSDKTTFITTASYTFLISIKHNIPLNGIVKFQLPTDLGILSTIKCYHQNPSLTTSSYQQVPCTTSTNTVTVTLNDFAQPSSAVLNIKMIGIQNPRTYKPTDNTNIYTYDSLSNLIDSGIGFSTQMNIMNTFSIFSATMQNKTNGNSTTYTVTFGSSVVPLFSGDILYLNFPTNVLLPSNAKCNPGSRIQSIICSNTGQSMTIVLQSISQGTGTWSFSVLNVLNPSSTRPSNAFTNIYITDSLRNNVAQLASSVQATVVTTTPANILTYSLYQDSLVLNAAVTYRILFTPTNAISPTGTIVLTWPSQVTIQSSIACFVTTNQKFNNLCNVDTNSRTITILNAFVGMSSSFLGSIQIELFPVTNPKDNRIVNGFTISTFDDANKVYAIDTLGDNILVPQTDCNYPCSSCLGSNPNFCLSCWQDDKNKFLQSTSSGQSCTTKCSTGFTTNGDTANNICLPCDPSCKVCADNGKVDDKFRCLVCSDTQKYYYNATQKCMSQCEQGFYQSSLFNCSLCNQPCQQCSGTANTCTACYQNSSLSFLFGSTCIQNCPSQYVGISNVCNRCQTPCSTCVNTTTQCTACDQSSPQKYLFAFQCYQTCPVGTVPDSTQMICKGCLTGCMKCDIANQTKCYQCQKPFILFNTQCLTDCPNGYQVNGNGDGCDLVVTKDLSLIYFPHLSCCVLMTFICIGGYFKDRKSLILSNMIVLFAPIEIFSFIVQTGLSVFFSTMISVQFAGGALLAYILINIAFVCVFNSKVSQLDEEYKFWRNLHPKTASFITFISCVFSFKMIRLNYSFLFGFDTFKAKFSRPDVFRNTLLCFTFAHIILSNLVILAIDAITLMNNFAFDSQIKITMIETGVISILMIVMSLFEFTRVRRLMLHYHEMDMESFMSRQDESLDKQNRRDMLKKIMHQFKGNQDLINLENNVTRHDEITSKFGIRRCNSMDPIANAREDDPRLVKSEPPSPKHEWEEPESNLLQKNVDNVYAESKPSDPLAKIGKTFNDAESQVFPDEFRVITRQGVDFLNNDGSDFMSSFKRRPKNKKRGRKNQYYTQIDAEDDEEADNIDDATKDQIGLDDTNLGVIHEEEIEEDKAKAKKIEERKKLEEEVKVKQVVVNNDPMYQTFRPTADEPLVQVPPEADNRTFNENDILGEFDRDEKGAIIFNQDQDGNFIDKRGRRINERGYLIDSKTGDIIENQQNRTMFNAQDIDERGEIPAPFCVEKHNFNPFKLLGEFNLDKNKKPIITKNKNGNFVDKRGRLVNQRGWLIDKNGHIIDYMGVKKFDKNQLSQDIPGDLPKLFNYQGQRYCIQDVCGSFDIDPNTGRIKLKKNDQGQSFDNFGRLVNNKGYLIDYNGNVVDKEGKRIFDKKYLSANGEIPKIFPFTKFNIQNIQGDFEMDPIGNPILEKNSQGQFVDRQGKRVNQRGYYCDESGNIIDKKGKVMFNKEILDQDGDIPEVFRTGLLKSDTASSLSRLMSEIERVQPEELYNDPPNKKHTKVIMSKNSNGGNTSIDSNMDDTPSNYNIANQRIGGDHNRNINKTVRIEEETSVINSQLGEDTQRRKRVVKRKKRVVQEYKEPSEKDIQLAKAYGGVAKGAIKRQVPKGMVVRGLNSPTSSISKQSKGQLQKISGSVAGFQRNQNLEESKRDIQNQSYVQLNETNDPSQNAVPEHHIREQRLKKQKINELKQRQKMKKLREKGPGDPDFEKMFGRDIDEFLEDSEWDIESFDNMSNFSRGTARSAFIDGKIRGLENIYLQRIDSTMKKGGLRSRKASQKPKFRNNNEGLTANEGADDILSAMSNNRKKKIDNGSLSNSNLGQPQVSASQVVNRNKLATAQTQYRKGPDYSRRPL